MSRRRTSKGDRLASAQARYEAQLLLPENQRALEPRLWANGCGRCGGDIVVYAYPVHNGGGIPEIKGLPICEVCRVDRVRRWGHLMMASAAEGRELRRHVSPPANHPGTARIAAAAGLVSYDAEDGSWNLTPAGEALLARFDAPKQVSP